MTNIQPKIDLLELAWERSFEDKEINELVKKLQLNLCFLFIDRASYCDIFYNLVPELEKKIDELKNENIKIKPENMKLKYDKEEVETENIKLKQDLDEFKKELEFKKNRKFQKKCILIAQVLLGEKPIIKYHPLYLNGLELNAFFQKY
ncbi:25024_t:CDS:2 [Racocetra persica]|uniref:25024_t:CDS:1 n=1 Tax=Racocetra persica TaxID=160502 RepID=A0ACA9S2P5_9GLOM|nr:25024_t:CDS:2 [Racocetra persica]